MNVERLEELQELRKSGELSDICVTVNEIDFHLHKFPLFLNSEFFRALCRSAMTDKNRVVLPMFPGGNKVFSLIADYCYGLKIDINTSNVVELRCAAEFLQMRPLAKDADITIAEILNSKPSCAASLITSACMMGECANQTNILSLCYDTAILLIKKRSHDCSRIFQSILQLPVLWFIHFVISARDAGIKVIEIARLAGEYIDKITRCNMDDILEFLKREMPDEGRSETIAVKDLADIVDGILLELPFFDLSEVMKCDVLCLLYRLAVNLKIKSETLLLTALSSCVHKIPQELMVTMTTRDVINIIEHTIHEGLTCVNELNDTIDNYLRERVRKEDITLKEFHVLLRTLSKLHRQQHDTILLIAEELFSRSKFSMKHKMETLELLDKYRIHEETLREISERNVIPSSFVVSSALAIASRLRNHLSEAKESLKEKTRESREFHASIRDAICGQWKDNEVKLNVNTTDPNNTRVQFAKVLPQENIMRIEHEVYDGKVTLCVQSRATSRQSNGAMVKKFLFDPFDERLIEITQSKHNNLIVGEHYEKTKHNQPYWPFDNPP
ncbi:root phototropism protein 2-like [Xenia sp. Carnegie-2017]|uniref:root phototropism protein 2-like n=1 Tax=Xenia sp. Carnegie-2017 TaxID=2897299 RepID=UPI001F04CE7C|nr:root phototropism protein 2-like [Xenia sp. Carnegie-2017]